MEEEKLAWEKTNSILKIVILRCSMRHQSGDILYKRIGYRIVCHGQSPRVDEIIQEVCSWEREESQGIMGHTNIDERKSFKRIKQ